MAWQRIYQSLSSVVQWRTADKCLLAAGISLSFSVAYLAALWVILRRPDMGRYFDRAFLAQHLGLLTALYVGGWASALIAALALRRRVRGGHGLVYVVCQLYAISFAYAAYLFGTHTTVFTGTVVLIGVAFGFVLFEPRPVWWAAGSFMLFLTATTVAETAGVIPYAPLLLEAPFKDGTLATSWVVTIGGLTFVLVLWGLGLIGYLMERWRSYERQLAQTTDQLARANDAISRYVAQQVVEQIRLGNYDAVDRQYRRRLTLFFSDIKGFTEVADRVEPEELSEILTEYFAEMTAIADRYGATIDKFMGDAIMIFFGAPVATHDRDQALRATRMAMAMQGRMQELREQWEKRGIAAPFEVRIGINTGVASVGNFGAPGRMDYTAIGRQVNLAARLQVSCDPGKILLSHSTWVLVRDEIRCVPRGEIQVKGIRDPVRVYEVTARDPASEPGPERLHAGPPPGDPRIW